MPLPSNTMRFLKLALLLLIAVRPASGQSSMGELASRAAMLKPMPGDRVSMLVYGDPSLSGASTLDELGRITLPRIGTIQADAYTIAALRDTIRSKMTAILKEPAIEVFRGYHQLARRDGGAVRRT
jgi:protein involved in polysaccharide export with SLBB domain